MGLDCVPNPKPFLQKPEADGLVAKLPGVEKRHADGMASKFHQLPGKNSETGRQCSRALGFVSI